MATILAAGGSDWSRRCDANCHEASDRGCSCICGGRYHGAGSSALAREQLIRDILAGAVTDQLSQAARRGLDVAQVETLF